MRILRRIVPGLLWVVVLIFFGVPALADVSLTVQPLVSELSVPPGAAGHIKVLVKNSGSDPERIIARPVDWRTLIDGSTTIEHPGAEGDHSITRFLSLSVYQFDLQPNETRELALTLAMPDVFPNRSASYWGGYLVNAAPAANPASAIGVAATVFVYENVAAPHRHMTLQSMRVTPTGNGGAKLTARLRNDSSGYCRSQARLLIEQAGRIVREDKVIFSVVFPGSSRLLTQKIDKLPAGQYRFELTFDYGGDSILDGVTQAKIR